MTPAQLHAARKRLGLSQSELAEALGVDYRTVGRWERGEREIPTLLAQQAAVMILRLCAALV